MCIDCSDVSHVEMEICVIVILIVRTTRFLSVRKSTQQGVLSSSALDIIYANRASYLLQRWTLYM